VYRTSPAITEQNRQATHESLRRLLADRPAPQQKRLLSQELRKLSQIVGATISQDWLVRIYRQDAGKFGLPPLSNETLQKIRLKPMRSLSGVQTVSVLTKPFPCPGQCIFCPSDIRMPKSYIASEPGAQRAERNSFDPYLQTYSRLLALKNMGHEPSKIEIIVLGGTWSYYPESYQIWFIHECFRALNDFARGQDDSAAIRQQIRQTVESTHRSENRVVDSEHIAIDGRELTQNYNQVISKFYLLPEIEVEGGLEVRREQKTWEELWHQHTINETSSCRCVGLTIETRPDNISEEEVLRIRKLGCTKTQIGIQSLSDEVLKLNKRGHDTAATRRAIALLRQAGLKIHAHWMPNLYGSSVSKDLEEFIELFTNLAYKPDELKIYPCALIPTAELMQYYQDGRWQPYTPEELDVIISTAITSAPPWVRLTRVVRDIPTQEMATDHLQSNLRQTVENRLRQSEQGMPDIRAREIRGRTPEEPITLDNLDYQTSTGKEVFIQFIDAHDRLLGFLRLALPDKPSFIPELGKSAIIRELHVYGEVEQLGGQDSGQTQHRGYGKQLITKASELAREAGYTQLSVISAVGTRQYYQKQGFTRGKLYQKLEL
jgi:elongator complex protein 3